jgi:hypothetical protein
LTLGKNQKRILQHRAEGNHLQLANALKSRTMLHYSATKLHQKGILIDIEGLPHAHFKSTFFDISPAVESGVFDVTAKFMGVSVEKVQLNIQVSNFDRPSQLILYASFIRVFFPLGFAPNAV